MRYVASDEIAQTAFQPFTHLALEATVVHALLATGRPALRGVNVNVHHDTVVLRGRVPSYYEKQLAQTKVQQIAADRVVVNEIAVVRCD